MSATSAPTGCNATLTTVPGPLTSAGGNAQLNVSGCTPAAGLTYNWSRNGAAGANTAAGWTDTPALNPLLGPNTTDANRSTNYQVSVCNGAACATFPSAALSATVPPAPRVEPTGCVATRSTSPSPLSSAGGSVQLSVSGCSPATGLTYNWSRNGSPGWRTSANPSEVLAANTGSTAVTYRYQVQVCNGAACTSLLPAKPLPVVVPATGPSSCDAPLGPSRNPLLKAATPQIFSAVLPASRAVAVNATATAFATILNAGPATAQGCAIKLPAGIPATFSYQTTNPLTNALTGSPNTPAAIAPGGSQTYVFSIKPTAAFAPTDIALQFTCASGENATSITGVNSFLLTASSQPTPDIVAEAATLANDGIVRTPGTAATGAFSVATFNVGVAGTVVASVDAGANTGLPATFTLCQTNAQAACLQPPAAAVTTTFAANQTATYSVFVTASGTAIPLDAANARVFVRFRSPANATFGATSVALETQTTLAGAGGSLQFGPVKISANPGAVVSGTSFTAAASNAPAALPPGFSALNSAYNISLSNAAGAPDQGLNAPIEITLSYAGLAVPDPRQLAVLHYNRISGKYATVTVRRIDTAAKTLTFDSRQFSDFVVAVADTNSGLPAAFSVPGFAPGTSGFQIGNNSTVYLTPGGNAIGMTSFAGWYASARGSGLASQYPIANQPASVQDLIALRAQINQSSYWNDLVQNNSSFSFQHANPDVIQRALRLALTNNNAPVVLIAGTAAAPTAHAMLVYGYDANNLLLYDPKYPGQTQLLPYNDTGFGTYDGWSTFAYIGSSSLGSPDTYAQLAAEADAGFASAQNLTITNPPANATINDRQTQLQGALTGGACGQAVYYWANGLTEFKSLGSSPFNQSIDVAGGRNTVVVIAGVPAYGDTLSNTLANATVRIVAFDGPAAARLRATLHWDQSDADVDLYLTDPAGNTAWWAAKATASGVQLDLDNVVGAASENTTLATTALPGLYKVRLHYFSNYGSGPPASGTLSLTLNERAAAQVGPLAKSWSIASPNPANYQPNNNGPDWIDIATIDIVNGNIYWQ